MLKNAKFVLSAPNKNSWIDDDIPEIILLGRSNVGKSTLINAITGNNKIAKVSSTPGRTRLLNFFDINNGELRIVDAPGYGYAGVSKKHDANFAVMMSEYLSLRENLKGALLLLDSRRTPNQDDVDIYNTLVSNNIPIILIATKYDKLNQSERATLKKKIVFAFKIKGDFQLIKSSNLTVDWIDEITKKIYELI